MLRLQTNYHNIEVNFTHFGEHAIKRDKAGNLREVYTPTSTLCQIFEPGTKDEPGKCLAEATASVHITDQFNYEQGRKIAFARALRQLTPHRIERRHLWEAYRVAGMPAGKVRF